MLKGIIGIIFLFLIFKAGNDILLDILNMFFGGKRK